SDAGFRAETCRSPTSARCCALKRRSGQRPLSSRANVELWIVSAFDAPVVERRHKYGRARTTSYVIYGGENYGRTRMRDHHFHTCSTVAEDMRMPAFLKASTTMSQP